jgi:hypothetical protein
MKVLRRLVAETAPPGTDQEIRKMMVELTVRRGVSPMVPESPIEGIRVMALFPRQWRRDFRHVDGDIVVRLEVYDASDAEIRRAVSAALTDPEIGQCQLVSCELQAGLGRKITVLS